MSILHLFVTIILMINAPARRPTACTNLALIQSCEAILVLLKGRIFMPLNTIVCSKSRIALVKNVVPIKRIKTLEVMLMVFMAITKTEIPIDIEMNSTIMW